MGVIALMTVVVGSGLCSFALEQSWQLMFNLKKGGTMSSPNEILSIQLKLNLRGLLS